MSKNNITVPDGVRNAMDGALEPHPDIRALPKAVRLIVRPELTSFTVPAAMQAHCYVDWGDTSPLDRTGSGASHVFTWNQVNDAFNGDAVHDGSLLTIINGQDHEWPIVTDYFNEDPTHDAALISVLTGLNYDFPLKDDVPNLEEPHDTEVKAYREQYGRWPQITDAFNGNVDHDNEIIDWWISQGLEVPESEDRFTGELLHDNLLLSYLTEHEGLVLPQVDDRPSAHVVTLFFHLKSYFNPGFGTGVGFGGGVYSELLSQVLVQLDPFPFYVSLNSNGPYVVIDSPDYTAPNGVWENLGSYPRFEGSTFTTGPRIWADLSDASVFPYQGPDQLNPYQPFYGCDAITKIEYQGDFSDRIDIINRIDLWYREAEYEDAPTGYLEDQQHDLEVEVYKAVHGHYPMRPGKLCIDAYPRGGSPKVINNYIDLTDAGEVHYEYGLQFPAFGQSRLQQVIKPLIIPELLIGCLPIDADGYGNQNITLPMGQDCRDAENLEAYYEGVGNIVIGWRMNTGNNDPDFQPHNMIYGKELIGVDIHPNCSTVVGAFDLDHTFLNESNISMVATPLLVERYLNAGLALSLYDRWDGGVGGAADYRALTSPKPPTEMKYCSSYLKTTHHDSPRPWSEGDGFVPNPNHKTIIIHHSHTTIYDDVGVVVGLELGGLDLSDDYYRPLRIKRLPEGLEWLGSYCDGLYRESVLGTIPGNIIVPRGTYQEGEKQVIDGYVAKAFIPKLPSTLIDVIDYLHYTFTEARGRSSSRVQQNRLHAVQTYREDKYRWYPYKPDEPQPSPINRGDEIGMKLHLNVNAYDGPLDPQISDPEFNFRADFLGPGDLMQYVPTEEELLTTYEGLTITDGIVIEASELPNLQHAIRWQDYCFYNCYIDPTQVDNLLVPLPSSVKCDQPHYHALDIGYQGDGNWQGYLGHFSQSGYKYEVLFLWKGPVKGNSATMFPVYDTISKSARAYNLADVTLPVLYKLNADDNTYQAFEHVFNDNFYGEAGDFYAANGVTDLTGLPAIEYIGGSSGTLNSADALTGTYRFSDSLQVGYYWLIDEHKTGQGFPIPDSNPPAFWDQWERIVSTHITYNTTLPTGPNRGLNPYLTVYYVKSPHYSVWDVSGTEPDGTGVNNFWPLEPPYSPDEFFDLDSRVWTWNGLPYA